jgi:hypothetical protein
VWWYIPIFSELGRLRQENCKFKFTLGYIVSTSLKTNKQAKNSTRISLFLMLDNREAKELKIG